MFKRIIRGNSKDGGGSCEGSVPSKSVSGGESCFQSLSCDMSDISRRSSFSGGFVDLHCHHEGAYDNLLWIRAALEDQTLVLLLTLIPNLELVLSAGGKSCLIGWDHSSSLFFSLPTPLIPMVEQTQR